MAGRCPRCQRVYAGDEQFCSRDATALVTDEAAADPWIGRTLDGRYEVRRFIGRGGMGSVYEAHHVGLDRRVAIKFLLHENVEATALERFRREAKMASRVVHEHVVQVYDIGAAGDGGDYIAMEYVEGRDLQHVLREEGALGVTRAIEIARAMLRGLHAIHEQDIVHRDVKPSNVLLTVRGSDRDFVKLTDFGIARALDQATLTAAGQVVGTPWFMAPEQFQGKPIDRRADLYAVGITLFAMLAGDVPFSGSTAQVAAQHVHDPPPDLARLRSGLPAWLYAAVSRALAKSLDDRFADALTFARALDGGAAVHAAPTLGLAPTTQAGATVSARRPPAAEAGPTVSARRPPVAVARRRARWPWLVVAGLAAISAVVAARQLRGGDEAVAPARLAQDAREATAPASIVDAEVVAVRDPVDAAAAHDEPVAAPDAAVHVAVHAPKKPVVRAAAPDEVTSTHRCQCAPVDGPDRIALCPHKGASLCRCDLPNGHSLCPHPLDSCKLSDPARWVEVVERGQRFKRDLCERWAVRCDDPSFDRFHMPGIADQPCTGYPVLANIVDWRELGDPAKPHTGHLECDVCAGADTHTYEGAVGGPCDGYYWRNGQPLHGTIQNCE